MSEPTDPKRVAVVTGASRGIGAAIARGLARSGRTVVLAARQVDRLEAVKAEIEAAGGRAGVHPCDLAEGAAVQGLIEKTASEHGRLDILVNNAGMTRDNLLLRMSDDEFDQVLNVNLRAVFVACRAALRPMMRGRWGRIVNIGSVSGLIGNPGQANYAAAKAALVGFTRSLAREMGGKCITANVVAPGFIDTEMTSGLPATVKEHALAATPLRRFGQADEVAAAVSYLTGEEAGFTTGQVLVVDGGMAMV